MEDERYRKTTALEAYRQVLRGIELPPALGEISTGEDLEAARQDLLEFVAGNQPEYGPEFRAQIRDGWHKAQSSRQALLEVYGVPFLSAAINRRLARAAAAEEEARLARGVTISLHLPGSIIDRLVARGLVEGGEREDAETLACAARTAISGWLDRPLEPAPALSAEELRRAAGAGFDRARRLMPVPTVPGHDPRSLNRAYRVGR